MPPSFESLVASGHHIRKEEDFDPLKIAESAAIFLRKQVSIAWACCVLLRASEAGLQVWNEMGSAQLETYSHGRDND
eukprot:690311-Pleurochrysis_carterae.AAC.1